MPPDHGTSADIDEAAQLALKDTTRKKPGPKPGSASVRLRIDRDFRENAHAYSAGYRDGRMSVLAALEFQLYCGEPALDLVARMIAAEDAFKITGIKESKDGS